MLLEIMKYTDKQLEDLRFAQTPQGKWQEKRYSVEKWLGIAMALLSIEE